MYVFLASSLIYRCSDIFADTKMSYTSIIDSAFPGDDPLSRVDVAQSYVFHLPPPPPLFYLVEYLVERKLWNKFVLVRFHLSYSASTDQFNILPSVPRNDELLYFNWSDVLSRKFSSSVSHFLLETTCATQLLPFSHISKSLQSRYAETSTWKTCLQTTSLPTA